MHKSKKVLFLVPYPLHRAPSQRFRVELFLPILEKHNIHYKIQSFLDEKTWDVLYKSGASVSKAWGVLKGFLRRVKAIIWDVPRYEYIFIHREASPVGPPVFEFLISKLFRKKIIYDFDDAIWIPNTSQENKIVSWVKAFWKIKYICKWSYKVVGGNKYLCQYAESVNDQVVLIPTCVDTENKHNQLKEQKGEQVVVGWTGSHSTMQYLNRLVPILARLVAEMQIKVLIISNKAPDFNFNGLQYLPWKEKTEVQDLLGINIGIMPLETDPWCEGKCGFKLIQYLALGIPAVASPVGVNKHIIREGENGFLCSTDGEWYDALKQLIQSEELRQTMGSKGRGFIVAAYSVQANADAFVRLFS